MKHRYFAAALAGLLLAASGLAPAQTTVKKVVLQGFWWDYTNGNFRNRWADYLVELTPRLKGLGIDAVWIPPAVKNDGGTNSVGYAPFDGYDLGDKYQKGSTGTRLGTKDELLRLVAVLHANGIEVVQDVVLNHATGAGTATGGAGGLDPAGLSTSANAGYKNFRNACYATPLPETADNAAAYLARAGRWPKNAPNFHAHQGHNSTSGDYALPAFGPDFCYGDDGGAADGFGPSSNAAFNPAQGPGYSRTQARNWVQWMKKQTGIDGVRWDAVKNFGYAPQQDWIYNLKYLNGFANGGEAMLNTGEFVGSQTELDAYTTAVNGRNGGTDFAMGTFDFGLRGAIYGMVASGGTYDLGQVPAAQQNQRVAYYPGSNTYVHRTAPFVNSHDSFRPQLSASGNYTGTWNTRDELVPHIAPADPRLSAAYAIALALDGNPHVYIEDLFDLGRLGNRYAHLPADAAALPVRADVANLIWCHQHLNFKAGAYFVRWQAPDHLVVERGGRALIGINDNFTTWQTSTVASSFAPGTVLKDYSGANGTATATVGAGGQVAVTTPPCNGTALLGRRGYAVWAPVGQDNSPYTPARAARTAQEWELADDLGDSHCRSLGQGGALPANSTAWRTAGKVFARAGGLVEYFLYPARTTGSDALIISLFAADNALRGTQTGTGTRSGTYTPAADEWLTVKVRNATAAQAGQRAYVQLRYEAPAAVDTRLPANSPVPRLAVWTAAAGTADALDCRNYEAGRLPAGNLDVLIPAGALPAPVVSAGGFFLAQRLTVEAGASFTLARGATAQLFGDLVANGTLAGDGTWRLTGLSRQPQRLRSPGPLSLACVVVANDSADVALDTPLTVRDTLVLAQGRLALGPHHLTLNAARVLGASPASYVLTANTPASGGSCFGGRDGAGRRFFAVGTDRGYAPFTYAPQGPFGDPLLAVRVVDGILADASTGPPFAPGRNFVGHTWFLTLGAAPNCCGSGPLALGWEAGAEGPGFDRATSALYGYGGPATGWTRRSPAGVPATGSGPYEAVFGSFSPNVSALAVGSFTALAARAAAGPVLVSLYPNPTVGTVQLVAGSPGAFTLRLTNALGQVVLAETTGSLAAGQARLNAALATAAPGVYVLLVRNAAGATQQLKLVRE